MNSDQSVIGKRKWVVLATSFFVHMVVLSIPFNLSVLYLAFLDAFGRSKTETSLIPAVMAGCFNIAGVFNGLVVSKLGIQAAGFIGGILATGGMTFTFFASSVMSVVGMLSIVSAIGLSLVFISSSTSLSVYFKGRQNLLALTFVSFGSGVGAIVVPYVLEILLQNYGWRGCVLILAAVCANLIPCMLVCVPVASPASSSGPSNPNGETDTVYDNMAFTHSGENLANVRTFKGSALNNGQISKSRKGSRSSISGSELKLDVIPESIDNQGIENRADMFIPKKRSTSVPNLRAAGATARRKSVYIIEVVRRRMSSIGAVNDSPKVKDQVKILLKNKAFVVHILSFSTITCAINTTLQYLIDFFEEAKGYDRSGALFLYLIMNLVGCFSRVLPGMCKQFLPRVSVMFLPVLFFAFSGAALPLLALVPTASYDILFMAICGVTIGAAVNIMMMVPMKLAGSMYYSTAIGMILTCTGVFTVIGGPIAGFMRDFSGSYQLSLLSGGGAMCFSVIASSIAFCLYKKNPDATRTAEKDRQINVRRFSRFASSISNSFDINFI